MHLRIFLALLFSITACHADGLLRLSKVAKEQGEGVEELTLTLTKKDGEKLTENLLISKEAIITEADVEDAWAEDGEFGAQIIVKLSEAGAEKMKQATGKMKKGVDRIAVIVDGEVVAAPVMNAVLGKSFVITGNYNFEEASELAKKFNKGKNAKDDKQASNLNSELEEKAKPRMDELKQDADVKPPDAEDLAHRPSFRIDLADDGSVTIKGVPYNEEQLAAMFRKMHQAEPDMILEIGMSKEGFKHVRKVMRICNAEGIDSVRFATQFED